MYIARKNRMTAVRSAVEFGRFTLIALVSAASMLAGSSNADSTMFRGGSGLTGASAERISFPLALNWKFTSNPVSYNPSSPAVANGEVFFSAGNRVYCINAQTGAQKWRYPVDAPMNTAVFTSPAVADGIVYFGAGDGKLYAISTKDGAISWAFDTRSSIGSSPVIVDNIIYFGSGDGRVWAVDARTHEPVSTWRGGVKTSDEITGAPAVANGMVYALSLDQVLHAIGIATGKERYSQRLPSTVLRMSPVASGDYVYVANGGNITCFLGKTLNQRWFAPMPSDVAVSPAVTDQSIFIVTTDNYVYALDARTGRFKWRSHKKLDFEVSAPPTVAGNSLIIATNEGSVYALDVDKGSVQWTYKLSISTNNTEFIVSGTNIAAAPVVSNGTLFLLSDDGALSAMRTDAVDSIGPTITEIEPSMGVVANGEPPFHFEAKVIDEGCGVNPDSLKITLDGESGPRRSDGAEGDGKTGFRYDVHDDILEYDIVAPSNASSIHPLANGKHTVTVTASDWRGNTSTKSWSFTIDNTISKRLERKKSASTSNAGRNGMGGGGLGGGGGRGGGGGGLGGGGG